MLSVFLKVCVLASRFSPYYYVPSITPGGLFFSVVVVPPRHQASQILNSFNIDYHTVDVLSDDAIRQGIKEYSQWPTIPQLYVCGEFIGGSDIMIEMYQTGELGEMIEKVRTKGFDCC
jgi:Grx4 family monothiol glutaredoxin